jgi:hypothetical protein
VTVKAVEPQIDPVHAWIVADPGWMAKAAPELVASLVTDTTAILEERHITEASVCVVLSVYVPVAMNRCVAPEAIVDGAGVIVIETRFAGANANGKYRSTVFSGVGVRS